MSNTFAFLTARARTSTFAFVLAAVSVFIACSDEPTQPSRIAARAPSRTMTTSAILTVSPLSYNFGDVAVGMKSNPQQFDVENTGTDLLYLTDISIGGPNAADFTVAPHDQPGCSFGGEWGWPTGMPCHIGLQFVPSALGPRSATLTIQSAVGTVIVPLVGNGVAAADVSVNMTAGLQGKSIVSTIVVKNDGPSPATLVDVVDAVPAGTTFANIVAPSDMTCVTPAAGSVGPVKCSIPIFASGAQRTIQLTLKVAGATKGSVVNTVSVTSAVLDPVMANNSASVTTNLGRR